MRDRFSPTKTIKYISKKQDEICIRNGTERKITITLSRTQLDSGGMGEGGIPGGLHEKALSI